MTECTNDDLRDLLPLLAHGALPPASAERVRAHVAGCAACLAELSAIETARLVLRAEAPRVDVGAITRAVTAGVAAGTPALRVERGGAAARPASRRAAWPSRQLLAAAASVLIVAAVAIPFLSRTSGEGPAGRPVDSVAVAPVVPAGAGGTLGVGEPLSDLSADDLSALLDELDRVEATIAAEPATLRAPLVDAPEGL